MEQEFDGRSVIGRPSRGEERSRKVPRDITSLRVAAVGSMKRGVITNQIWATMGLSVMFGA